MEIRHRQRLSASRGSRHGDIREEVGSFNAEVNNRARIWQAVGRPTVKRSFGPVARHGLKLLAGLRGLRGTLLDPFGWSLARRSERALAEEYITLIRQLLQGLNEANVGTAAQIAALPDSVRGFGRVRQVATAHMREQASALLQSRDSTTPVFA